jgi:hypothetical protein
MVVFDVLGRRLAANTAHAVLLPKHPVEVLDPDAIAPKQVIVPRAALPFFVLSGDPVVARFAIE